MFNECTATLTLFPFGPVIGSSKRERIIKASTKTTTTRSSHMNVSYSINQARKTRTSNLFPIVRARTRTLLSGLRSENAKMNRFIHSSTKNPLTPIPLFDEQHTCTFKPLAGSEVKLVKSTHLYCSSFSFTALPSHSSCSPWPWKILEFIQSSSRPIRNKHSDSHHVHLNQLESITQTAFQFIFIQSLQSISSQVRGLTEDPGPGANVQIQKCNSLHRWTYAEAELNHVSQQSLDSSPSESQIPPSLRPRPYPGPRDGGRLDRCHWKHDCIHYAIVNEYKMYIQAPGSQTPNTITI